MHAHAHTHVHGHAHAHAHVVMHVHMCMCMHMHMCMCYAIPRAMSGPRPPSPPRARHTINSQSTLRYVVYSAPILLAPEPSAPSPLYPLPPLPAARMTSTAPSWPSLRVLCTPRDLGASSFPSTPCPSCHTKPVGNARHARRHRGGLARRARGGQ